MATYKIRWKKSAVKDLQHLPKEVVKKIYNIVSDLSDEPFPPGVRKLVGSSTRSGFVWAIIE